LSSSSFGSTLDCSDFVGEASSAFIDYFFGEGFAEISGEGAFSLFFSGSSSFAKTSGSISTIFTGWALAESFGKSEFCSTTGRALGASTLAG
jgi:hypothetical protein